MKLSFLALILASASGDGSNPIGKVLQLMNDLTEKIKADGEAADKGYKEFFEWCDDAAKNAGFEIKTSKAKKGKLEAAIAKRAADIEVGTSKIEDLTEAISTDEKELARASGVRKRQAADFSKGEAELIEAVDTLDRAIGILEREMAKNPAVFAQVDTSSMGKLVTALSAVMDAAAFSAVDKQKLVALVQSQSSDDDDDDDTGAPAPDAYKTHSGGIVDILSDMKEKAESQLADLRKSESSAKHNFEMLQQSLERQVVAETKDLDEEKSSRAAAEEKKSGEEAELVRTTKALAAATAELASVREDCIKIAADHEASIAGRKEELKVIAEAKKILSGTTSSAVDKTYSFLQLSASMHKNRIAGMIKHLARQEHSVALAQLASRILAVMQYSSGADVFAKVKGLINDMIAKLEAEASAEADEKAYCDEELAKTEAKKADLEEQIESLTTKLEQAASKSTTLKGEVKVLQKELAVLAREQADMDKTRQDQHAAYIETKGDLELGLSGVQQALEKLREYYGSAALIQSDASFGTFMQQPAVPMHSKSSGAGGSIISILEVCESDFSNNLAETEAEETDSQDEYDKLTQENKVSIASKKQDVKYKTEEFVSLDKSIVELSGDKGSVSSELSAVNEYYGKIKDRCIAKPETYEERTKRRTAEIAGLKDALTILEEETALIQRKRRSLRHSYLTR